MSSRERILKSVRDNQPAETPLPGGFSFATPGGDHTDKFSQVLQGIGGSVSVIDRLEDIKPYMDKKRAAGVEVVIGVDALEGFNIGAYAGKPAAVIERVDTCVLRGALAVAENGAIWMPEKNLVNRLLPFLCQHLVIVIGESEIVATMHDAYARIRIDEDGYGAFIAGPSKTADIEQSLVIGAHGPLSLDVFILRGNNVGV